MIVGALLCRNEANRYLTRCLENALQFCDHVIVVDDGSTDDTVKVCRSFDRVTVIERDSEGFWGDDETSARALLWREAAAIGDWIYVFDADHELIDITPAQFRQLCDSDTCTAWAFPLYDCWDSPWTHRTDGYWQAWHTPRTWLFKALPYKEFQPEWPDRKEIHVGHAPINFPYVTGLAPGGIRHWGYVRPEHRLHKREKYTSLATLTPQEREHAESIMDENPVVEPLPNVKTHKILTVSVVRKPPAVVEALCKTLQWQRFRSPVQHDILLIPNFSPKDSFHQASVDIIMGAEGIAHWDNQPNPGDDYGEGARTRQWTDTAWHRVGAIKDKALNFARQQGYDYVWLCDADVLCDPTTLQGLLDADAPIVSGVYWTFWTKRQDGDAVIQHCGPQVWLRHPYFLDGRGWTEAEFRRALIDRQRVQVWGLGACTLIRKDALAKGVSFAKVGELPPGPMSDGEDRHFCHRATVLHLPMYADAWPDIWHAYHPDEYNEIKKRLLFLNSRPIEQPGFGDLVSVQLTPLEPVWTSRGWIHVEPQYVRGRMGSLPVLPEIEEEIAGMTVGDKSLVSVHFPVSHEMDSLRGQKRIVQVELLGAKTFAYAPTIEEELFVGKRSGRFVDATQHPPEQVQEMANG